MFVVLCSLLAATYQKRLNKKIEQLTGSIDTCRKARISSAMVENVVKEQLATWAHWKRTKTACFCFACFFFLGDDALWYFSREFDGLGFCIFLFL